MSATRQLAVIFLGTEGEIRHEVISRSTRRKSPEVCLGDIFRLQSDPPIPAKPGVDRRPLDAKRCHSVRRSGGRRLGGK